MKNPEKQLAKALKMMQNNSYLIIDNECGLRRKSSNHLLYHIAERESILVQEEIGRKNKIKMFKEMREAGITKGTFEERRKQYKFLKLGRN